MSRNSNYTIKGVIFDLDGTLVDSLLDITEAINAVFEKHEIALADIDKVRKLLGHGLTDLVSQLLPESLQNEDYIAELVTSIRQHYLNVCVENTRFYKGIPEIMDQLSLRSVKMALLSNKHESGVKAIADKILNKWSFSYIAGANEHFPLKPNPAMVYEIIKHFGLAAEEVLFIGDSETDIKTARNAGVLSAAVSWGYRDVNELVKENPDFVIENAEEILDIIDNYTKKESN